jgi:exodeoxyribonuclease-3
MRLLSWNINGLRSLKDGFLEWLYHDSPDILALQETKARSEDLLDHIRNPKGYHSFFESSKIKKGYSGVAIYSKEKPKEVEYGLGKKKFDDEGRVITAYFEKFVLINCYFPNTGREERVQYKMEFNDEVLACAEKIQRERNKVIICGDFNVAHEEIDLARPKENEGHAGFRPEERAWIDEIISAGYRDTFRYFYPEKKDAYTWWDLKSRARDRNVGWRIDYFFVSKNTLPNLKRAFILDHVLGSDHAPCGIELSF